MKNLILFFLVLKISIVVSQKTISIVDIDNNPINDVAVIDANSKLVSISNSKGVIIVENENFPIILTKHNFETLKLENYQIQCVLKPNTKEIETITVKPINKLKMLEEYLKKSIAYSGQTSDTNIGYYFAKSIVVYNDKDTNFLEVMCKMMLIKNKHNDYQIYVTDAKKAINKFEVGKDSSTSFYLGINNFNKFINNYRQSKNKEFNLNKKYYINSDINISEYPKLSFICSSKKIPVKNKKTFVFEDSLLLNYTSDYFDTLDNTNKFLVFLKDKLSVDYIKESLSIKNIAFEKTILYQKVLFSPTIKPMTIFEKMGFFAIDSLKMNNMQKVDDLQEYFKSIPFDNKFSFNYQFE